MGAREELESMFEDVNEKILAKIDELRSAGKRGEMSRIRIAREYFCDALVLALVEKNVDEAKYKLARALAILREI